MPAPLRCLVVGIAAVLAHAGSPALRAQDGTRVADDGVAVTPRRVPIVGRVVDGDADAAGARIVVRWREHAELPGITGISLGDFGVATATIAADAHGRFRFDPPCDGPFDFTAFAATGERHSVPRFPVMAAAALDLPLGEPMVCGGAMLDPAGDPLPALTFDYRPDRTAWDRHAAYALPPRPVVTATTDAAGRYRVVLPSSYLTTSRMEPFVAAYARSTEYVLPDNWLVRPTTAWTDRRLKVDAAVLQRGTIQDQDGAPIVGARVFDAVRPHQSTTTDATGAWQLVVAPRAMIWVAVPGHAPRLLKDVAVPEAPSTFRLPASGAVRARLRDRHGAPIAGVRVLWSMPIDGGIPVERVATTAVDGGVRLDGVSGEAGVLGFVEIAGTFVPFALHKGDGADLGDVVVGAPRELTGQVVGPDAVPVVSARVAARPRGAEAWQPWWVTYTDRNGRYRFARLPTGTLDFFVDAGVRGCIAHDVTAGDSDVSVRMPAGGVVRGVATDVALAPMPFAWVMLLRTPKDPRLPTGLHFEATQLCGIADASGAFSFTGVPEDSQWGVQVNGIRSGQLWSGTVTAITGDEALAVRMKRVE